MIIALFSDTFDPDINGVATSVMTLKNELEKNNHTVYVVTTNFPDKPIQKINNVIRIPGKILKKIFGYKMAFFFSREVFELIKNLNIDVIHVHTEFGIGLFARIVSARLKLPLVYTYHTMYEDYTHYITKGYFDSVAKKIAMNLSKKYCQSSGEVISPSLKTYKRLREYGVNKFVNIVPTGIPLSKFDSTNLVFDKLNVLKEELKIDDCFTILTLGRMAKEKSVDLIIDGFKELKAISKMKTKLIIVGDGPALQSLIDKVKTIGLEDSIIFTGRKQASEVPYYYALSDVFVSASLTETQGLTFVEALASKTPVLARFDQNLVEVISDGYNGFFYKDANELASKILILMTMESSAYTLLCENALKKARQYSSEEFYNNIIDVYKRVIRNSW